MTGSGGADADSADTCSAGLQGRSVSYGAIGSIFEVCSWLHTISAVVRMSVLGQARVNHTHCRTLSYFKVCLTAAAAVAT